MKLDSIPDIVESFREGLQSLALNTSQAASNLYKFPKYGNLYIIYRSIALVISRQQEELKALKESLNVSTAKGQDLDNIAGNYAIFRSLGQPAKGNILISSNMIIPARTILTYLPTGIQYETDVDYRNVVGEGSVSITSITFSEEANLVAGSNLTSTIYPNTTFIVGRFRNPFTKAAESSLGGGRNTESDEELRSRILSRNSSTNSLINIILTIPGVSKVYIKDNAPSTGFLTIYIDSNNSIVINQVTNIIAENIDPGTAYIVRPLNTLTTSISITISIKDSSLIDDTVANTKTILRSYIQQLSIGSPLNIENIIGVVLTLSNVTNCRVNSPIQSILPTSDQSIKVDFIDVNVEIKR